MFGKFARHVRCAYGEPVSTATTVQKPNKPPEQFDQAKLDSMLEPFSVRVERIKGNTRSPIPMPMPPDGGPSGSGFDKVLVMGLEQWLFTEWCGGGMLRITVTDSDQPKPQQMAWTVVSDVPERVPPPLAAASQPSPGAVAAAAVRQQQQGVFMSSFPNGLPGGVMIPPQPQFQQGYPQPQQWTGQPQQPQMIGVPAGWMPQQPSNELAEMRAALTQANERSLKLQHENERARETTANNERMSRLETSIAKLAEAMTTASAAPAKSPELEAMREANRLLTEKFERAEREAAADRREQAMRDAMREQAANTQRLIEGMQAQLAASLANKGPDPMLTMMLESNRLQAETAKENAREQTKALEKVTSMVMSPMDLARFMKDSQQSVDQTAGQITRAMSDVIGVQTQVMRGMAESQGGQGGKGIADVVDGAFDRFGAFAQQWTKGKAATEKAQHDAQAAVATAQAQAMQAQASVINAQHRGAAQPIVEPAPPAPTPVVINPNAGLGGPAVRPGPVLHVVPNPNGPIPVNGTPVAQPKRIGGRTDEEWFGPLHANVVELRAEVAKAIESVNMTPPRLDANGQIVGATPDIVANAVMQASQMAHGAGMPIPAMIDLLDQGRFADFMDLLLPDVGQGFRDNVIQMLAADGGTDTGEDDDEDEDEDEKVS